MEIAHSGRREGRRVSPNPLPPFFVFFFAFYLTYADFAFCCSECLLFERDVSDYLFFRKYFATHTYLNPGLVAVGRQ